MEKIIDNYGRGYVERNFKPTRKDYDMSDDRKYSVRIDVDGTNMRHVEYFPTYLQAMQAGERWRKWLRMGITDGLIEEFTVSVWEYTDHEFSNPWTKRLERTERRKQTGDIT